MAEGEFYNIERILDRRRTNGKYEYKIKWEGYPISQSTWEPMKNLESAKELVDEYNRLHPIPSQQKNSKSEKKTKEKDSTYISKKRNKDKNENENEDSYKNIEAVNNLDNIKKEIEQEQNSEKNNKEESKSNINNNVNTFEKTYTIDDSLKNVVTVKQQNQKFVAVVDKMNDQGDIIKEYIPTEELRRSNPWILLDFYESKIKFT